MNSVELAALAQRAIHTPHTHEAGSCEACDLFFQYATACAAAERERLLRGKIPGPWVYYEGRFGWIVYHDGTQRSLGEALRTPEQALAVSNALNALEVGTPALGGGS